MPLKQFRGYWAQSNDRNLQQNLPAFAEFLSEKKFPFLKIEDFKNDLNQGWYFESNIPTGYGAGSSGALVAGILKKYGNAAFLRKQSIPDLKNICGKMESFFHGSSSGTDPLISFLNKPIHLKKSGSEEASLPAKRENGLTFFLLDTKLSRSTTPFVNHFLERMKEPTFAKKVESELMLFNQKAIESFLKNEEEELIENFEKISHFQFENFQKMIPDFLNGVWREGLGGDIFKLKICGAGGGGFMIGLTENWEKTQKQIQGFSLIKLKF